MCLKDARTHSASVARSRFPQNDRAKMNRQEYQDALETTYLMAQCNEMKDLFAWVRDQKDLTQDELLGEIQIRTMNRWNEMRQTRLGLRTFNPMGIEDLMEGRPVQNFIKKGGMVMRIV